MNWRPFSTLTGRLVLVTIVAVAVSYAVALVMFSNERGAALRRAAETAVIERVAYTTERLREAQPAQREAMVRSIRDFGIRYSLDRAPAAPSSAGDGARLASALSERLGDARVQARSRTIEVTSRRWSRPPDHGQHRGAFAPGGGPPPDDADSAPPDSSTPRIEVTEVTFSVHLADSAWLDAVARLPGPRPAPISLLISALIAVVATGAGAALISRQIGRPLAHLAAAARALGSGQSNVVAPVSGPDDVRRASTAFNAMAERLGRQLGRQRQMLWALSHDLRTPITALRLRAELIEDEATRQRLLAPIAEMEQLTEQALSLARAGASEEQRVRVDLSEIARTLCGELQDMGVSVTADAPTPIMVDCRPSEIARALRNLAENAAKYAGAGVLHVYPSESGVVAEVTDDGPGVAPEQLARINSPFFRSDSARSEATGAGLGLAIAQAIADEHGGTLELANRTPRGFSAKLVLPD
ncbi:MAG: HAMP domain-containing histidine kinase [Proteobacteria bacterium]|nr:HAMP domain-containing histidine kinase [Pseudomonadota bacterium]